MPFLFDTDALSEPLRRRPLPRYVEWLRSIPREEQYTSAVCIGELFRGAFRSESRERHLDNLRKRVLPAVTVVPFDSAVAEVYGAVSAALEESGERLADADLQIAATALRHGLTLVTGNLRHFGRVPELDIEPVLADARND